MTSKNASTPLPSTNTLNLKTKCSLKIDVYLKFKVDLISHLVAAFCMCVCLFIDLVSIFVIQFRLNKM